MHKYILSGFNIFMIPTITRVIARIVYYFFQRGDVFTSLLLISIIAASCESASRPKEANTHNDSIIISLPVAKPISSAEFRRINTACEQWYDSVLRPGNFNGGILVAKNGGIIFEKYCGTGHIGGTDTITANTPTHIASVSKTFTAMAVLKLVQEGKIQLDAEFSKYFPSFNYPGVTIRNLLSHRSGLPNYLYFMDELGWDKKAYMNNQDVFDYLVNRKAELTNISSPNTHFTYCNTNYALLAVLIETVTGKKYSGFLQQTFFIPLQMKNTFVYDTANLTKTPPSYDWRNRLIPANYLDGVYGDKNIYTTPQDLLIWDRALSTNTILTPETLEQAYTPYSNEKPGIKNYGLGWRMNIYPDGKKMIFHNGWWHGSNASFIRLLKENATIIVIGNKFTRSIYHAKILCNLFGDYYTGEEDEENDNLKPIDSLALPKLSKKDSKLQELFKDKNKVTAH